MLAPDRVGSAPDRTLAALRGLGVVNVGQPIGTPEAVILDQLDRFAAQVMPATKRT